MKTALITLGLFTVLGSSVGCAASADGEPPEPTEQAADPGPTATTSAALSANGWYKICHLPASAGGHIFLLQNPGSGWPVGNEHTGEWEYVHRLYSTYAYVGDNYGHTGWISIRYLCDL